MTDRIQEDFFQRVKDVNWESEPEVYWMAGEGYPYIINGAIAAGGKVAIEYYTSEDGKHWDNQSLSQGGGSESEHGGFSVIYAGGWMREGLVKEGRPVWVLLGATGGYGMLRAASAYSFNGKDLSEVENHDQKHVLWAFRQGGSGVVNAVSERTFPDFHDDYHTSSTGRGWVPPNFHPILPDSEVTPFRAEMATFGASSNFGPSAGPSAVACVVSPDNKINVSRVLLPSTASAPSVTPFVGDAGPAQKSVDKIFVQGLSFIASGKLRKGPWAGKTVKMEIKPYNSPRPSHGGSSIEVTDSKTGELLGYTDCGINRSITIAYGHYVFCVGGSVAGAGGGGDGSSYAGIIASTDTGQDWGSSILGNNQINVLAVGPRK